VVRRSCKYFFNQRSKKLGAWFEMRSEDMFVGGMCAFAYSAEAIKDLGVNSCEIAIAGAPNRG
jgi:hypothetical protein